MNLRDQKFLFLDCQTTGMRPSVGALLEVAWSVGSGRELGNVESRLITLPEGERIPPAVQEITGIRAEMLADGISEDELRALLESASLAGEPALVHYAQFERSFIEDLFIRAEKTSPFPLLCTYRIARKLYPSVPSRNIRGLVGNLGFPYREIKRAGAHVQATMEVWSALTRDLEAMGICDFAALTAWLEEKPKKEKAAAPVRYEYRVDRLKRLELPENPGVYRMLSKSGEILYVGKATSLKDRVNSYFRGKKGRDKRKLELMAQVWDLNVTVCGSPLEAALLETDEIKRWDPPYNVSLKTGRRQLHFYNRDFSSTGAEQSAEFPLGPFRGFSPVEQLRALSRAVAENRFTGVFYDPVDEGLLAEAYQIFAGRRWGGGTLPSVRALLALGLRILRETQRAADLTPEEEEELLAAEEELVEREETAEDIADRLDRMLLRAAANYRRSKHLTRLLNAEVRWMAGEEERVLRFFRGRMSKPEAEIPAPAPWSNLDIQDYDRMSVLLAETRKGDFRILC